jgi:signal transduction histidine kinase/ActR/RegA family two-component response regulator
MRNSIRQRPASLRLILIIPFLLQIFAAVGLTGYLSWRNGQKSVHELADRLQTEMGERVVQHLNTYLDVPHQLNQINVQAVRLGLLQLNNLDKLGQYFWKQMQTFPIGYINFGNTEGQFIGVERLDDGKVVVQEDPYIDSTRDNVYETDDYGKRTRLKESNDVGADHREESWYLDPIKSGKPVWSEIYQWEDKSEILSISSSYPVYSQNSQIVGAIGVDLILSQIGKELRQIKLGSSGEIFILERNGLLVASSSQSPVMRVTQQKADRLKAIENDDPLVKGTAKYLQSQFGEFQKVSTSQNFSLKLNGKQHFGRIEPWKDKYGLDWLVVLVVPESDFTAQINANTRNTILLCLAALAIAAALGIYTSRWISRPITRLSTAAEAIAAGQLDQRVPVEGARELRTLAEAFNKMAQQLRESFTALTTTNETLETRVEERTSQFKRAVRAAIQANSQSATALQAEEKAKTTAEEAKRSQENFFATLNQELKAPLMSILGYANLLTHAPGLSLEYATGAKIIQNSGTHLLTMINNLLYFAALGESKVQLELTEFDFPDFLRELCSFTEMRARDKHVSFHVEITEDIPPVMRADVKQLRQVLINLLDNAVKFTNQGSITFRVSLINEQRTITSQSASLVQFQVIDTGIGINPADLGMIFEPFAKISDPTPNQAGKGLGLATSQKLVKLMGGQLQVRSQHHQGSIFWFSIPLVPLDATMENEQETFTAVRGYIGKKRSILLVDEQVETVSYLQDLLTPLGFKVTIAEDGEQGLTLAKQIRPDLIVTNILMKGKTGLRMAMEIREIPEIQRIPIIALSNSSIERMEDASLRAGCNVLLSEPIDEQRLFSVLKEYLDLQWIFAQSTEV